MLCFVAYASFIRPLIPLGSSPRIMAVIGLDHTKTVCVGPGGGGCTEESWVTGVGITF